MIKTDPKDIPQSNEILYTVKLTTGEEIMVTLVSEDEFGILVEDPMVVKVMPIFNGNESYKLLVNKWITTSRESIYTIPYEFIMNYSQMDPDAYAMYVDAVNRYSVSEQTTDSIFVPGTDTLQ